MKYCTQTLMETCELYNSFQKLYNIYPIKVAQLSYLK